MELADARHQSAAAMAQWEAFAAEFVRPTIIGLEPGQGEKRRPARTSRRSTRAGCHVPPLPRPPPTSRDLPRPPQPEIFETACFFVTLFHRYADAQARAAARGRRPLPASAHP